ncbi:MAG: hypothetical protein CL434_01355 [Acidimicrobiaceae bacterium]|nr:hypothetical protein [Acidimicrobiaceae bacterium]
MNTSELETTAAVVVAAGADVAVAILAVAADEVSVVVAKEGCLLEVSRVSIAGDVQLAPTSSNGRTRRHQFISFPMPFGASLGGQLRWD